MGMEKAEMERKEDEWSSIAYRKGYVCTVCGTAIPKEEYRGWMDSGGKDAGRCNACLTLQGGPED